MSKLVLLFWAGHLCCLAGFEWSRLWAFAPGRLRITATMLLTLAYLWTVLLSVWPPKWRPVSSVVLVAWSGIFSYPLLGGSQLSMAVVTGLSLFFSFTLLRGKRRWAGLVLTLIVALLIVCFSSWGHVLGVLLATMSLVEGGSLGSREPEVVQPPGPLITVVRAEIFWKGFAQLYASCAPGEGERFTRKVLDDTVSVIAKCGGVLEKGSEHRGVYRFPSEARRRECHGVLLSYAEQLEDVLNSVDAPKVRLVFNGSESVEEGPVL